MRYHNYERKNLKRKGLTPLDYRPQSLSISI
ncbi:IS3 family transposase [Thomasclavelia ramosa]